MPSADGNGTNPSQRSGAFTWGADGEEKRNPAGASGQLVQAGGRTARAEAPSDCPVENGVVYTRWGSVQLGTLLAGIATGFEWQSVAIRDVRTGTGTGAGTGAGAGAGARAITGLSDSLEIDNRYAATLAGDLAEVALWRGPKQQVSVGASGNWNNTQTPRWYFIGETNEMTDAEIRGGLDGLIMAHNVREWNNQAGGLLRLSTVLERYYSLRGVFDEDYRACERQNHYKEYATTETLRAQTTSFASALYDTTPFLPTIHSDGLAEFASDAVEALDVTVPTKSEADCEPRVRSSDIQIEPKVDLIVVVDCRWDYDVLTSALFTLAEDIKIDPLRSKITVLSGQTHQVLFETSDRLNTFAANMKENITVYKQCATGMKLNDLLEGPLYVHFTTQLEEEKDRSEAGVHANVVVFMPDSSYDISSSEVTLIEQRMDDYGTLLPDVKFLVFATQDKNSYKLLVEDHDKDLIIFHYNTGSAIETWDLSNRIRTIPRRIANPICGAAWEESPYDPVQMYEVIPEGHTAYYRIHPKYLFGIESEKIKIREQSKGTVRVCHSRTNEYPLSDSSKEDEDEDDDDEDDSVCKSISGSEFEIELNTPCAGSSSFETCNPLYISIEVTESDKKCGENTCRAADDVAVEIRHSGLTCGAAALRSPITFVAAMILIFSKILFSS